MNNRYLYKAKDKDDGKWYEGYYMCLHDTTYCCMPSDNVEEENTHHYIVFERMTDWGLPNRHLRAEIDPSTICQCTGLKDKNGKLIWENDVVRCIDKNNDLEFIAVIEFGNPNAFYSWGYQLRHIKGDKPNLNILLWIDMEDTGATCEVIGNKFDNPELLEVEE